MNLKNKKTLITALCVAGLISAQTKPKLTDIKPPTALTAPVYLFGIYPSVGLIALDGAGFSLDKTTTPPTIRAIQTSSSTVLNDDYFTALVGQIDFQTSVAPKSILHVFKNGMLMRLGVDYTVTLDAVTKLVTATFMPVQPILGGGADADFVTLSYQK